MRLALPLAVIVVLKMVSFQVLDAFGVIAGIAAMLAAVVAIWYAIGWVVGLLLRRFPLAGGPRD